MNPYCCDALKQAIAEGYLYEPIGYRDAVTEDGKKFVDMKVLPPAIEGKPITPRSKKHKPALILTYCPFCSKPFKEVT